MMNVSVSAPGEGESFQIGPITVRVLEDGSKTDNRIGAVEITVPPRTNQTPQHLHRMHDETFLVLKGKLRFTTKDAQHDAVEGTYIVVPTDAAHTFSNPFDEVAVFYNSFTPAYYVQYLRDLSRLAELTPENILSIMANYATQKA